MLVDRAGKYRPQTLDELASLPAPEWLVSQLLGDGTLAVLYGAAGVGKTFVALDIALSIATGRPLYDGAAVAQWPVVYVAGEGVHGIVRRARAWEFHHGRQAGNFFVVREAVPFLDSKEVDAFIEGIESKMPALVIVDTLARCFGDGDENSTPDMNRFIGSMDRIRENLACTVLVVHHSGHEQDRERGSSGPEGLGGLPAGDHGDEGRLGGGCSRPGPHVLFGGQDPEDAWAGGPADDGHLHPDR